MPHENLFADRINHIKPSAIREIFALLKKPGLISFAGGWPDPALFPVAEIDQIMQHILATESATALQYGATQGDDRLRDWLCQRMNDRYGMGIERDNLIITSGSQQGVYLTNALLVDPDDIVVVEAPTFVGAFGATQTFRGKLVGIEMDDDGLDLDALETLLQHERIKYVYTIPEFQNPSGRTLSLERRKRLIALAEQYDFIILEDAPYSDLRYEGEPMPTIYALDPNQRTIYLGSFSKTFSPMRVGWMIAPKALIAKIVPCKQAIDVNTPTLTQALIYHFCERGLLDVQIDLLCKVYGDKRDTMFAMLDRFMPAGIEWTVPAGGMFIWATLPQKIDATDVFHAALKKKVAFVNGAAFYPDTMADAPKNVMRLNFITPSKEKIVEGIELLGSVIKELIV